METLYVAHFGHPLLKGAKHWSFLLPTTPGHAYEYQLTGSTYTYAFKAGEVELASLQSCMGRVAVGTIDSARQAEVMEVLEAGPITRGSVDWCCHDWIMYGMTALRERGFSIDALTHEELLSKLAEATVDF
ncbi:hypothetical protein WOLCODRAFT_98350 [Wolfiporia cocos MD-104 SS10]|uniref:Uncharacterized protein n=1 Tax=Wolfiporia cocos (strain MD-104) TaxID=742152 RepID=A0A2H3JF21_WOLCO|nr:hypothetical protein WOLCODRAFT_98350 [Wolfiporia cocos MD-104 SS10]